MSNINANKNANKSAPQPKRHIVISERDNIAALMEGSKVVEFFIHRGDMLLGDVYLASVENILPSIDAAFVNLGADRMGFLHASDVPGKGDLKERLKPKQHVVVQIMKEPTGHKGPRVSTALTFPGRFLVLMPEERGISVSRKILSPKERSRLKSIVSLLKPSGVGVIIRTEAEGQTEDEIKEDIETLLEKWKNIVTTVDTVSPPALIHRDQDLLYRVIREACTEDVTEITIDTPFGQHRVNQLIQTWNLGKNIKVAVHKGTDSLLVSKGIDKEIKQALQSKVNLPSGGYLYVQQTEALTVIDVNSGRFTSSQTQSETIRQTNLEAVDEIARQLRLRNIGGMVIVDFIDMDNRVDQLAILEAFEVALEPDKSKPQVGQLSDLGLVELTRHRQGQSLVEIFAKKCPACGGSGHVLEDLSFSPPSIDPDVRARMAKAKVLPRMKQAMNASRQELANSQSTLKAKAQAAQQVAVKQQQQQKQQPQQDQRARQPQPQERSHQQQRKQPPEKPEEHQQATVQPITEETIGETMYMRPDMARDIETLTIDKLRKTYINKKYFPELSKVVRYAGVPMHYAKEQFGEAVNVVDVFTVLAEMEAAFARAAASPQPAYEPDFSEATEEKKTETEIPEIPQQGKEFQGRYGIAEDEDEFEEFSEEEEPSETKPQPEPSSEKHEESSDAEEDEETEEKPKKSPARRGRRPTKSSSAPKKRGRPKSK